MAHDYNTAKKIALKVILILGAITIVEVLFALWGKGYIIEGFEIHPVLMGGAMIAMSMLKAYLIVYEFMHMKYEVPGLAKSVLLPMFLLVWGIIAFLWEGAFWNQTRASMVEKNEEERMVSEGETGLIYEITEKDFRQNF